jgi:hypothetical protein
MAVLALALALALALDWHLHWHWHFARLCCGGDSLRSYAVSGVVRIYYSYTPYNIRSTAVDAHPKHAFTVCRFATRPLRPLVRRPAVGRESCPT